MRRCDVLVVGAGLAGLWTARLLAEAGLDVVLADDRPAVDRRIRTTGIFVRRTLVDFPLPDELLGPEIRDVVLYSPAFRAVPFRSTHPEFRVARMGPLTVWLLDRAIAAGVDWWPGTRCHAIATDDRGVIAGLHGAHRGPLRARFVIGADGARSRVAEWLGLSRNREWIVGVEEVYRGIPLEGVPALHCVLSPSLAPGYLAWLVHDGEEIHVGVGGYPARFEAGAALTEFKSRLPLALSWSHARLVDRRGGLIPVGGVLPRIANSMGLLVGDAAGAVSPLTAGGIDPCLRLSELAARVTIDFLASANRSALAAYDGSRFRRRFSVRLGLRSIFSRIENPLLLEAMCAVLGIAPLSRFGQRIFFGRGSFPDVARFQTTPAWLGPADRYSLPRSSA